MKQSESNDLLPSQDDESSSDRASENELCLVSCVHDRKHGLSAMIKCSSCMQWFHPACCGGSIQHAVAKIRSFARGSGAV